MMNTIKNAMYWKMLTNTQCNIPFEQFQISEWEKSGSNVEWVLVCVRNLIFCTDENESEFQFSIHLMHLNALPRALRRTVNSHCALW